MADADDHDGGDDQRQRRHQRILRDHHPAQADHGQKVARQRGDQQVERAARRLRDEGLRRDEARWNGGRCNRRGPSPASCRRCGVCTFGDDVVGDARQHHRLGIGGKALDRVDRHDRAADDPDGGELLGDENLVDDVLHDPRRHRRGRRDHERHRRGEDVALPVLGALIAQQPPNQAQVRPAAKPSPERKESGEPEFWHLTARSVVRDQDLLAIITGERRRHGDRG